MTNPTMAQSNQAQKTATSGLFRRLRQDFQTYTMIVALIAIWGYFAVATKGSYISPQNISNLFRQMSVTSLMAAGMVLVIVTGNIDLSVGRLAGCFVGHVDFRRKYLTVRFAPVRIPL